MTTTKGKNPMKPAEERLDVYQRITNQIIEAMERGADQWQMPWHRSQTVPMNALTRKPYRGVNVLSLWATAAQKSYRTCLFATYSQWQELGAQVRKGEKSALVVFWKFSDKPGEAEEGEEDLRKRGPIARGYNVFNADQVDGFTVPDLPTLPNAERIESADRFFQALQVDLRHGGSRAFYNPSGDYIQLPPFELFKEAAAYYATLAHESIHWTAAPHRLDRDLKGRFGNEAYAAEELIAELGAAFLCSDLGLTNEPRPDHAAYIQNWLTVLRKDHRAIFTAASRAQAAADYLHSFQPLAASTGFVADSAA